MAAGHGVSMLLLLLLLLLLLPPVVVSIVPAGSRALTTTPWLPLVTCTALAASSTT
jgi:hypothetical protein